MSVEMLTQEMFDHVKKIKHQVINIEDVSDLLKKKLGEEYTSEVSIAVKNNLKEHDKLEFFREGTYNHEEKFYYCVGNWIAVKGLYKNCVEAKEKLGMLSWQRFVDDWED